MALFSSKQEKTDIEHHERAAQGGDAQARRMERAGKHGAAQLWREYADDCRERAADGRR